MDGKINKSSSQEATSASHGQSPIQNPNSWDALFYQLTTLYWAGKAHNSKYFESLSTSHVIYCLLLTSNLFCHPIFFFVKTKLSGSAWVLSSPRLFPNPFSAAAFLLQSKFDYWCLLMCPRASVYQILDWFITRGLEAEADGGSRACEPHRNEYRENLVKRPEKAP